MLQQRPIGCRRVGRRRQGHCGIDEEGRVRGDCLGAGRVHGWEGITTARLTTPSVRSPIKSSQLRSTLLNPCFTNTVAGILCTFPLVGFHNKDYSFVSCQPWNQSTTRSWTGEYISTRKVEATPSHLAEREVPCCLSCLVRAVGSSRINRLVSTTHSCRLATMSLGRTVLHPKPRRHAFLSQCSFRHAHPKTSSTIR